MKKDIALVFGFCFYRPCQHDAGEQKTKQNIENMNVKNIIIAQLVVFALLGTAWCVNLYKLTQCDFSAPYKGEIIHAVGLIPPAAIVTAWFNDK